MVSMEKEISVPDSENVRIYEACYKRYQEIYPHNREMFIHS